MIRVASPADLEFRPIASVRPATQGPTYGPKADSRNQPPPADVLHPVLAIQPPRDDAEHVEQVLVRCGACEAHFPANSLPPRPASPQPHDLRVGRLKPGYPTERRLHPTDGGGEFSRQCQMRRSHPRLRRVARPQAALSANAGRGPRSANLPQPQDRARCWTRGPCQGLPQRQRGWLRVAVWTGVTRDTSPSEYAPRADYKPPEPDWKTRDGIKEKVPRRTPTS